jgi:hypothetical protein
MLDYQDLQVTRDGDFASLTMPYTGIFNAAALPEPWTEFTPQDNATPIEVLASPNVGRGDLIFGVVTKPNQLLTLQPHQIGGFGNVWGFFSSHKSRAVTRPELIQSLFLK